MERQKYVLLSKATNNTKMRKEVNPVAYATRYIVEIESYLGEQQLVIMLIR